MNVEQRRARDLERLSDAFWEALDYQRAWLTRPVPASPLGDVFLMRTRAGSIFDDAFWEVFQGFPFSICHVAYYGPERLEAGDRMRDTGVFELRWSLTGPRCMREAGRRE